jgi:hypothetical protein
MSLLWRIRAVFDATRYDEEFAGPKLNHAIAQLDDQAPTEHEKEIVSVGMRVPDKLALNLDDHNIMAIELGYRAWRPMLTKLAELIC